MGNEMWQARVPDNLTEELHEYKEEQYMSKSEVVRKALRELVQDETTERPSLQERYEDRHAARQSLTVHTTLLVVGTALGYGICMVI